MLKDSSEFATMDSSFSEEQPPPPLSQQSPRRDEPIKECLHKTKTIQFFSRSTPIILQNDNGPCPLLAICNVLLLRNQLNLNVDISEVSQEKLLSLVAERLIDSNSNTDNKDAEYVQNQQQNISDAIDLLPRLTTGIDVNIKFQRIGDFEFTPECAIFDLLDIPLYHGWLVDPQDYATAKAIGSKSYNTITRDLVSLQEMVGKEKDKSVDDCVDFAAATAATLGVPSPCLSRAKSFTDSPPAACASDEPDFKKGDALEEAELLRVLKLSENNSSIEESDSIAAGPNGENVNSDEHLHQMPIIATSSEDKLQESDPNVDAHRESPISNGNDLLFFRDDLMPLDGPNHSDHSSAKLMVVRPSDQLSCSQSEGSLLNDLTSVASVSCAHSETKPSPSSEIDFVSIHDQDNQLRSSTDGLIETSALNGSEHPASTMLDADLQIDSSPDAGFGEKTYKECGNANLTVYSGLSDALSGNLQNMEATESINSSVNDSEPIYEGEECILDSVATTCDDQEPVYEGEVVLAKQADGNDAHNSCSKDEITPEEGDLISNFLKNNASQLTFYGLFSLQDGLKERELCVFFRNNHFCTMFKFEGQLYLLTTDQGYLNQPGIVWEKLNEVNGDSVFYDSDFKEFRPESQTSGSWDEQNVVASTADFLASIENSGQDGSSINSDLQLAIALQQQEFEQQQQQQPQRRVPQDPPQPPAAGGSRLIVGPQTSRPVPKPSTSSPKQEKKSKDTACSIM